jgi:hypothetical protein
MPNPPISNPEVLFISEEKLKAFTSINYNLSPDDLVPFVFDSQNIYLQNLIGASYKNALEGRIYAGTTTTPDQTLLDNFIGPYLCNYALYLALPTIKYRIYNKGVLSGTSENADTVTLEELQFLMTSVKNVAENYGRRLQEWLNFHSSDYPEYAAPNIEDGQLPDKANSYSNNLVIPHYPYAANKRLAQWTPGRGRRGGYYGGIDCYNLPDSNS